MNKLDYNYGNTPDPTTFRIQASGIAQFFEYTNSWYRQKLLGEEGFKGNTSSVLGTCLHWAAENYIKDGRLSEDNKQEMYNYIKEQAAALPDLVNEDEIRNQLTPMWKELRSYIQTNPISLAEPFVELQVLPGITVGGSIDAIQCIDGTTGYTDLSQLTGKQVRLIDWKTTSQMSIPSSMSKGYEWQLLVYSYVLNKLYGIRVTEITNVYITQHNVGRISPTTGKPLKDYPSIVGEVSKPVTQDSIEFIESVINVVAHSVQAFVTKPELRFLLAQDWRLKDHTADLGFTQISQPKQLDI